MASTSSPTGSDESEENEERLVENLHSPFFYSEEYPLPEARRGRATVPTGIHYRSYISKDCEWGWMYNHSIIQTFPISHDLVEGKNPRTSSSVNSDPYYFPAHFIVSCSTEIKLHNKKITTEFSKLLVGLNIKNETGGLVIFCPYRGQPLKFISVHAPVTSLTVLSHYEEGGCSGAARNFFNEAMITMIGVVAVGLQGGEVLIVDLGLDHYMRTTASEFSQQWDTQVMSKPPIETIIVNPHQNSIVMFRRVAIEKSRLIALSVIKDSGSVSEMDFEDFEYCNPEGEIIQAFPKASVKVTALYYIQCTGSLVVGFSFGGFQIWRLDTLTLSHSNMITSTYPKNGIFGFSFSQPIDDPKNYCYLWVMYGKNSLELDYSHVELHCMEFEEKVHVQRLGYLYKDLKQIVQKFSFRIEDFYDATPQSRDEDDDEDNVPLEEINDSRYHVRPFKIWDDPKKPSLTFFAWECHRVGLYYIGIFDLNQWYSNQTLEFFRFNPDTKVCPYWVAIPCEINSLDKSAPIFDTQLSPKSVSQYSNHHLRLDIYSYPASLSFQMIVLTQTGISTFNHLGVQEKLLTKFISDLNTLMIQPRDIKNMFMNYGLTTVAEPEYPMEYSQDDQDRMYILTVVFDHQRNFIITLLANAWIDGSYTNHGCTIDLILEWITALSWGVRLNATEHWGILYTSPLECLPQETRHFINYSNFVWKSIYGVLRTMTQPDEVYWGRERFIEDVSFGLQKLVSYSASLLMMMNGEVLPERADSDILEILETHHQTRRNEVLAAINSCEFLDSEMKNVKPMMVDYLLDAFDENKLRKEWELEPDDVLYPPKHIGAILNMLLWVEDFKAVAKIISYLILDLRYVAHVEERDHLSGDFNAIIQLTSDEQSAVYNLWLMDQGKPEEVLRYMCTNSLYSGPWHSAYIISTALNKEEQVMGNLTRSCPLSLSKLYLNLLYRFPKRFSLFIGTSEFKALCRFQSFLDNFFKVADDSGCMGEFINIQLRMCETEIRDSLISYLKKDENFDNDDRLLSIYCNDEDLRHLVSDQYSKIKKLYTGKLSEIQKHRWIVRESLVKRVLSTKPSSIMQFLRMAGTMPEKPQKRNPIVVVPHEQPGTPKRTLDRDILHRGKFQQQFRYLNPIQEYSPLQRYVNATKENVLATEARRRRRSSFISHDRDEYQDSEKRDFGNTTGVFNLSEALKPPSVDCRTRNLRKSLSTSFCATPAINPPKTKRQYHSMISTPKPSDTLETENTPRSKRSSRSVSFVPDPVTFKADGKPKPQSELDISPLVIFESSRIEGPQIKMKDAMSIESAVFNSNLSAVLDASHPDKFSGNKIQPEEMNEANYSPDLSSILETSTFNQSVLESEIETVPPEKKRKTKSARSTRSASKTKDVPESFEPSRIESPPQMKMEVAMSTESVILNPTPSVVLDASPPHEFSGHKNQPEKINEANSCADLSTILETSSFNQSVSESEIETVPQEKKKKTKSARSTRSASKTKDVPESFEQIRIESPQMEMEEAMSTESAVLNPTPSVALDASPTPEFSGHKNQPEKMNKTNYCPDLSTILETSTLNQSALESEIETVHQEKKKKTKSARSTRSASKTKDVPESFEQSRIESPQMEMEEAMSTESAVLNPTPSVALDASPTPEFSGHKNQPEKMNKTNYCPDISTILETSTLNQSVLESEIETVPQEKKKKTKSARSTRSASKTKDVPEIFGPRSIKNLQMEMEEEMSTESAVLNPTPSVELDASPPHEFSGHKNQPEKMNKTNYCPNLSTILETSTLNQSALESEIETVYQEKKKKTKSTRSTRSASETKDVPEIKIEKQKLKGKGRKAGSAVASSDERVGEEIQHEDVFDVTLTESSNTKSDGSAVNVPVVPKRKPKTGRSTCFIPDLSTVLEGSTFSESFFESSRIDTPSGPVTVPLIQKKEQESVRSTRSASKNKEIGTTEVMKEPLVTEEIVKSKRKLRTRKAGPSYVDRFGDDGHVADNDSSSFNESIKVETPSPRQKRTTKITRSTRSVSENKDVHGSVADVEKPKRKLRKRKAASTASESVAEVEDVDGNDASSGNESLAALQKGATKTARSTRSVSENKDLHGPAAEVEKPKRKLRKRKAASIASESVSEVEDVDGNDASSGNESLTALQKRATKTARSIRSVSENKVVHGPVADVEKPKRKLRKRNASSTASGSVAEVEDVDGNDASSGNESLTALQKKATKTVGSTRSVSENKDLHGPAVEVEKPKRKLRKRKAVT